MPKTTSISAPGYLTSEFWVALVPVIMVVLNVAGVHYSSADITQVLTVVMGAVATVYVAARTALKIVLHKSASDLHVAAVYAKSDRTYVSPVESPPVVNVAVDPAVPSAAPTA